MLNLGLDSLSNFGGFWFIRVFPNCPVPGMIWAERILALVKEIVGHVSSGLFGLYIKDVLAGCHLLSIGIC
jgi:hypothetical protein